MFILSRDQTKVYRTNMSVTLKTDKGWYINHRAAVSDTYQECQVLGATKRQNFSLKSDMFDIQWPFKMDLEFEKWKEQRENPTETAESEKKRKRKKRKNESTDDISDQTKTHMLQAVESLKTEARKLGHLQTDTRNSSIDNNVAARQAANITGPGDQLLDVVDSLSKGNFSFNTPVLLSESGIFCNRYKLTDIIHRRVSYKGDKPWVMQLESGMYLIPARSEFIMSDFNQLMTQPDILCTSGGYDLIVVDPPWSNKSVKRKRSYCSLEEENLLALPLSDFASPNCVVVVWVTNKPRLLNFVRDRLLPAWGVTQVCQWHWVKVTVQGELICDMDARTKKPYETLLIGKVQKDSSSVNHLINVIALTETVNNAERDKGNGSYLSSEALDDTDKELQDKEDNSQKTETKELPDNQIVMSVPCSLHSKKPPLEEVLRPYLPPSPRCLELFARNLWPGWLSWGVEALKHQHLDFYGSVEDVEDVT